MKQLVYGLMIVAAGCGDNVADRECGDGDAEVASGTACTWAGVRQNRGFNGDGIDRRDSWLGFVSDLTFAPDGRAWLVDWNNHRVRRVEDNQTLKTMIGTGYEGDGPPGEIDRLPYGNPEGADPTTVALNHPTDVKFAPDGTVVLAAWHNNKLRVVDPNTGILTVLAGNSYGYNGENVPAYEAVFNQPKSVAIDPAGRIYVTDQRNQRIRVIENDATRTIHTLAGDGTAGYAGDGGDASTAKFKWDSGITPVPNAALALRGHELFIADSLNHRIRKLNLDTNHMDCVAGTGVAGYAGDGGDALFADLNQPLDIEFGPDGRLYVADTYSNVIRAIDLDSGIIERVAGTAEPCEAAINCFEAEEGMDALSVRFATPYGIAFDRTGNLYVADTNNSRIVRIAK
jgi:sugar lactone lactonase YvrE